MAETQSTLFNKRAGGLWIAGAFVLLGIIFVVYFPSSSPPIPDPAPVKETPNSSPRLGGQPRILSRAPFQSSNLPPMQSDFYRTIIDNNLFRPLGWTPPRPTEPYRLLGIITPRGTNTPPQAILKSTTTNTTHIVSTGAKLDADTKIIDIQSKQILLETAGQRKILRLKSGFLQRR